MLTETERDEIEAEAGQYEQRQAACIEALMTVQRHRGWVSDECLRDVAACLEMTVDELDSRATFYNLIFRQPVGRHVILVCNSISCWILGCQGLLGQLQEQLGIGLGETTEDGRFTLLPIVCLGACDHAPVMMIDGDLHRDLSPQKMDEILQAYS